jgi:hypothetical protein
VRSDNDIGNDLSITNPACETCLSVLGILDSVLMKNTVDFIGEAALSYACGFYMNWDVCWGLVHSLGNIVIDNALEFQFSSTFFCEEVVPVCIKSEYVLLDPQDYLDRLKADKPESL